MTSKLADFGIRVITVIGSALVLQFFSEFYFLNEGPADGVASGWSALPALLISIYIYGLIAYLFHIALDRFTVTTWVGLLLAGAVFGWATEALVVPVVYEAQPVSWLWPSVGWHMMIDVALGWYLLRLAMRRLAWPALAALFVVLGLWWGLWGTWTWSGEEEAVIYTTAQFWNIALVTGTTWIAGTLLADWGMTRNFHASWPEIVLVCGFALLLFVPMALPFLPLSLGFAALVALTLAAMWRGRRRQGALFAPFARMPHWQAYALMPLMPVAAGLSYKVVLARGWVAPVDPVVQMLLITGTGAFLWAMVRAFITR